MVSAPRPPRRTTFGSRRVTRAALLLLIALVLVTGLLRHLNA
jgi:hypothetical protein